MNETAEAYRFNKDYGDLEQVAAYLPAFVARLAALQAAGQYRYNDSFKGHVPGIEGPDEDTAIYLLQGLERKRAQDEKVRTLLSRGYQCVESLQAVTKFGHVVLVPTRRNGGEWAEFREARIVPRNGRPHAVLPKGKRNRGALIGDMAVYAA